MLARSRLGLRFVEGLLITIHGTEQQAICIPGNHGVKLLKKLQGRKVRLSHAFCSAPQIDLSGPSFILFGLRSMRFSGNQTWRSRLTRCVR